MIFKPVQTIALAALAVSPCVSFSPLTPATTTFTSRAVGSASVGLGPSLSMTASLAEPSMSMEPAMAVSQEQQEDTPSRIPTPPPKPTANKKKAGASHGKSGILSPVVLFVKNLLNDDKQFNQLRAKFISLHGDVIAAFCASADTPFGQAALRTLFEWSDRDESGTIDETELALVFQRLGFDWLQEKQVRKIFERADQDKNGYLDMTEWMREAPKTLRTNLIKLAKKNGGELGLLA